MTKIIVELIKYGFFGLITTGFNYILYLGMLAIQVHYVASNIISYVIAVLVSYWFNNRFVFKERNKDQWNKLTKYVFSRTALILVDNALLVAGVEILGYSPKIAKIMITVFLLGVNYLVSKLWIFN